MADVARESFVRQYGGIYEHSPWVAEQAYEDAKDVEDPERLAEIFAIHVNAASAEQKLALIRAHPDLAGKAAVAGGDGEQTPEGLTASSRQEQKSAGIDQCTPEEYERFQDLNQRYKEKFGFPFIMAVRNSNRHEILSAFTARLNNDTETEFETAMKEIHKIARLRLRTNAT